MAEASLIEVFSSVQGEGLCVGQRHLFVRFGGCHRACAYCDTPRDRTATFRVERVPGSKRYEEAPNPVAADRLLELLKSMNHPAGLNKAIALTGGEPLLQVDFLVDFLPQLRGLELPVLLETAGDLAGAMGLVAGQVDLVAMDIKLESATGEPTLWEEHEAFMNVCAAAEVNCFVKLVVSAETSLDELREVAMLFPGVQVPAVIQPLTPGATGAPSAPSAGQVLEFQQFLSQYLSDVRVIPQCHPVLGLA